MKKPQILIVDDEKTARYGIRKAIEVSGTVTEAGNLKDARKILDRDHPEVVLLDLNLGGESGFDLLKETRALSDPPLIVIITAHGNERIAVEALHSGAFDYLAKPFEVDELRLIVRNALEQVSLRRENERLRCELSESRGYGRLIGESSRMRAVFGMIEKVAETDVTVLLTGESGSGKEVVAREIHARSPRNEARLVTVNCAAIPENLIESELFGHEKGAFTGALRRREGKFEQAQGGTLFLDEIGDMPLDTQAKILRVLEDRKVQRLGSSEEIEVDVRVVSATNQDLQKMVEGGAFREDLYYRLEVVRIHVPPLRQRREDLPALIRHFLEDFSRKHDQTDVELTADAFAVICRYNYPGNVRQLRNLLERLVVLSGNRPITEEDLPDEVRYFDPETGVDHSGLDLRPLLDLEFKDAREAFEKKYLLVKLSENSNNITHTSDAIGLHRQSLQKKLKDLDLRKYLN